MMRRGDLARTPVATVLRTAASEALHGQIEVDGGHPATIHLAGGRISLACWAGEEHVVAVDDGRGEAAFRAGVAAEEARLRSSSVAVLRQVLGRSEGWYFHDPLGQHDASLLWGWDVDDILREAANVGGPRPPAAVAATAAPAPAVAPAPAAQPVTPSPEPDGTGWRLSPTPPEGPLDAATWAGIVAAAGSFRRAELVGRLGGLPPEQADLVVNALLARGVLVPGEDGSGALLGGRVRSRRSR